MDKEWDKQRDEIKKKSEMLLSLNEFKSPKLDELLLRVLKELAEYILKPLAIIFTSHGKLMRFQRTGTGL